MAGWSSERKLTAITRGALSVPARQAVLDHQFRNDRTVLDYGCGRGGDVKALESMGVSVTGWDPYFRPECRLASADVVLMTYVLNIIEDPDERRNALLKAWDLAEDVLVVSARLIWDKHRVRGDEFNDGVITSRQTFQHLFGAGELRSYVEDVTGIRCVGAAPGIVYAFKNDSSRLSYLAHRVSPSVEWLASSDATSAIAAVVDHTERRGRVPRLEEMPEPMAELLSQLKPNELLRLVRMSADPEKVAAAAKRTTLDTLLFLALELFNGRGPFGSLPLTKQLDVRAFFRSYKEACQRADRLLFKLRDDTYVRGAMQASRVGKMTPTALYVHRRALDLMATVLRLYEHCAAIAAGRPQDWTIAKLRHQGRAVSWLTYPEFDSDPHPKLGSSYMVDLTTLEPSYTSYVHSANRPLLHRKHEFLAPDDPDVLKYHRLTEAELKAGLYANPHLIGTERGWNEELIRCGWALRGHRLIRRK